MVTSPDAAPSTPAAPTVRATDAPARVPGTDRVSDDDDPPATTLTNLFRQKASPIRFFIVILIWAIGVLIVAVDTRRRTRPAAPPSTENATAPASAPPAPALR
jgi:hypothetical protein